MTRPDVLVVGAGPAGSVAALTLARAGVRVRMIDRAHFPRPKLCGDTLNPGAFAVLAALDVDARSPIPARRIADRVRACALPISGMTVTGPGGAAVSAAYPRRLSGVSLERRELDRILVEAAVDAGVTFDEGIAALEPLSGRGGVVAGVRAGTPRGAERVSARLVIAADGRGSRIASALGLSAFARHPRRWAFGAYFEGVAGITSHGEMHIRRDGYIGIAPLPGGIANVCLVRQVDGRTRAGTVDPSRGITGAVAADPALGDRFRAASQVSAAVTLGPLAVEGRHAGLPGVLLAGDAAGFIDPMTGDGLRFALRGGVLAAEAALTELATGCPAWGSLEAARAREFSGKWRVNRALRALAGSPRTLSLAAAIASWWPAPVQYLVGVAGDVGLAPDQDLSRRDGVPGRNVPPDLRRAGS